MYWYRDAYSITTDPSKIDIPYVHAFLTQTYWSAGIPFETVKRSIENSFCFSVFCGEQQVGFARFITDKTTFGYLADVFIEEAHRGKGLSKWLMEVMMGHPDLQGFRRMMLATRDAHALYRQFGFTELTNTERWMHIHRPDLYKQNAG